MLPKYEAEQCGLPMISGRIVKARKDDTVTSTVFPRPVVSPDVVSGTGAVEEGEESLEDAVGRG